MAAQESQPRADKKARASVLPLSKSKRKRRRQRWRTRKIELQTTSPTPASKTSLEELPGGEVRPDCSQKTIHQLAALSSVEGRRTLRPLRKIWGAVEGHPVRMLVDTGAQVSVMSLSLCETWGCKLFAPPSSIAGVDASDVEVVGVTPVQVRIGSKCARVAVYVLKRLRHSCLVGLDVLEEIGAIVDLPGKQLVLEDAVVPFISDNWWGDGVVMMAERCEVKPGEMVIKGCVADATPSKSILWPAESLTMRGLLSEPAIVETGKGGQVGVRVFNANSYSVVLEKGARVALVENEIAATKESPRDMVGVERPEWLGQFRLEETELSPDQRTRAEKLLFQFRNAISESKRDLGRCGKGECSIDTGTAMPIKLRWRRIAPAKQAAVDEEISSLLKRGLIERSTSSWAAPLVVVQKKNGEHRICTDYRALNQVTVKDAYPLPDVTRVLDELEGNSWFSTLDLTSGYLQVPVRPVDRPKTAFATQQGLFEYVVMPFGLTNAPAQFSRIMADVFANSHHCATVFMDDVIVRAKTFEQALKHLEHVLGKLAEAGLKIRPDKCQLFQREVKFLGHVVSEKGVAPDEEKVEAVRRWPNPTSKTELSSFLGLAGYYRRFVKEYSTIAQPLQQLLSKFNEWVWTAQCETAFVKLKDCLTSAPVLGYPQFGEGAGQFILDVDASDVAAGAVLSQIQGGEERVIAYGHKTFNTAQRRYCTTLQELCGLVWFVTKFKDLVWGCDVLVRTDHKALLWLKSVKETDKMLSRWYFLLSEALELDFDVGSTLESMRWRVEHRPGKLHANADGLSRRSVDNWEKSQELYSVTEDKVKEKRVRRGHEDCPSCSKMAAEPLVAALELVGGFGSIRQWQAEEPGWSDFIERLSNKRGRPALDQTIGYCRFTQRLVLDWNRLCVVNEVLCRRNKKGQPRAVVPDKFRTDVLKLYHDVPGSLHEGACKMIGRVARQFYWLGMSSDIRLFVRDCDACQIEKSNSRHVRETLEHINVGYPNQRVHLDFAGPLPNTARNKKFILVMVDAFSGYAAAVATADTSAVTTVDAFLKHWVAPFGLPDWIHTDRGANFESELLGLLCGHFGVRQTRSTAYHPQGNGKAEQAVKAIKQAMYLHAHSFETEWDLALHYALMCVRSGVNTCTGVSPAKLFLGREMRCIGELVSGVDESRLDEEGTSDFTKIVSRLRRAQENAKENRRGTNARVKRNFDRGAYSEPLEVGSRVLLWNPTKLGHHEKFEGVFEVRELDSKKVRLFWEGTESVYGWVSRDRVKLLGSNDRWNDVKGDWWAGPREDVLVEGVAYRPKVGGGVRRIAPPIFEKGGVDEGSGERRPLAPRAAKEVVGDHLYKETRAYGRRAQPAESEKEFRRDDCKRGYPQPSFLDREPSAASTPFCRRERLVSFIREGENESLMEGNELEVASSPTVQGNGGDRSRDVADQGSYSCDKVQEDMAPPEVEILPRARRMPARLNYSVLGGPSSKRRENSPAVLTQSCVPGMADRLHQLGGVLRQLGAALLETVHRLESFTVEQGGSTVRSQTVEKAETAAVQCVEALEPLNETCSRGVVSVMIDGREPVAGTSECAAHASKVHELSKEFWREMQSQGWEELVKKLARAIWFALARHQIDKLLTALEERTGDKERAEQVLRQLLDCWKRGDGVDRAAKNRLWSGLQSLQLLRLEFRWLSETLVGIFSRFDIDSSTGERRLETEPSTRGSVDSQAPQRHTFLLPPEPVEIRNVRSVGHRRWTHGTLDTQSIDQPRRLKSSRDDVGAANSDDTFLQCFDAL